MKQVVVAAAALIVGVLLGGLQPRAELRALQEAPPPAASAAPGGQLGRDLATFFSPPPCSPSERPSQRVARTPDEIARENPEAVEVLAEMDAELGEAQAELEAELDAMEAPSEEEIALAKTALDLRRAQSMAALVEDVDPTEDQVEAIEQAYEEMNEVLVDLSGELVGMLADEGVPSRRDAMEFTAEALDAMLAAEESVEGLLDGEQLQGLREDALNPFNHIDPSIVDSLRELDQLPL